MAVTTYAAIDVGSNELAMKLYEVNKKTGIHELDYIRHTIELGSETYTNGKISHTLIDELCTVLERFTKTMKEYAISDYSACATSGLREATNQILVLDQIKLRTGIKVKVLSNSEQRFLCYKALAMHEEEFQNIVTKPTAIVDVGAGSIQISLYNKNTLVSTQNIKLGSLRIREVLANVEKQTTNYRVLISEYIDTFLSSYYELTLKKYKVKCIIGFGDQVKELVRLSKKITYSRIISAGTFEGFCQTLEKKSLEQLSKELTLSKDQASLLLPTAKVYQKMLEKTLAEDIYFADINLCDGLVADYAIKRDKFHVEHDFENDIIEAARNIAKRYQCNEMNLSQIEQLSLTLFDRLKKIHGLGKRERIYLQIASILHNVGEFINMNEIPQNSYYIIMSTEIIGISHLERELVANIVRYHTNQFPTYNKIIDGIDKDTYITLAKLTAILRLANTITKSHKQKFKNITVVLKETTLTITTDSLEEITLEQELVKQKADFFEEVYGILPVLKQRRRI